MIDRSMDGLVADRAISSPAHLQATAAAGATVVVGRHVSSAAYDTVVDNDTAGAALIVDHLVALQAPPHRPTSNTSNATGHSSPRCPTRSGPAATGRAMQEHGLTEHIDVIPSRYTRDGLGARQLLARPEPPTAIFAVRTSPPWAYWRRSPRPASRSPTTSRSPATTTASTPPSADLTHQRRPGRPPDGQPRGAPAAGTHRRPAPTLDPDRLVPRVVARRSTAPPPT